MSDLDYYWKKILDLKDGDRIGNERGTVFCYRDYMLLETEEGAKRTSCLASARYLASIYDFGQVEEIEVD